MKKIIKSILSIFIIVYLVGGVFLYIKQDSFLYFPTPKSKSTYEEKIFINENESIHATLLNSGNKQAIIYFGGNAENVDYNAKMFSDLFINYTVYLVKFRGYGESTGTPSEQNLYSDALFIYDSIQKQYSNISVIGRSLGSGVATFLASKREVNRLVLVTPFDSAKNIAQKKIPYFPMSLIMRDKYDSIARVDSIKAQTLILAAQNDRVIGEEHTQNLASKFPTSQVTMKVIEDEGHNSISNNKMYYKILKEFL